MVYKVKNISAGVISFEGVILQPGQVSEELSPEMYQRLFALYMNHSLIPMDEDTFRTPGTAGAEAAKPADPGTAGAPANASVSTTASQPSAPVVGEESKEPVAAPEVEKQPDVPAEPKTFTCPDHPDKVFASQKDLDAHVRLAKDHQGEKDDTGDDE